MLLTGYGNIIFLTSRAQNHYFSILTGYRNIIFLTSSTQNNYFSSLTGYENIICASSTCSKIIILSKQKIILGMKNIILLLYEGWNNYFKAPFGCQATGFMHELGYYMIYQVTEVTNFDGHHYWLPCRILPDLNSHACSTHQTWC